MVYFILFFFFEAGPLIDQQFSKESRQTGECLGNLHGCLPSSEMAVVFCYATFSSPSSSFFSVLMLWVLGIKLGFSLFQGRHGQ